MIQQRQQIPGLGEPRRVISSACVVRLFNFAKCCRLEEFLGTPGTCFSTSSVLWGTTCPSTTTRRLGPASSMTLWSLKTISSTRTRARYKTSTETPALDEDPKCWCFWLQCENYRFGVNFWQEMASSRNQVEINSPAVRSNVKWVLLIETGQLAWEVKICIKHRQEILVTNIPLTSRFQPVESNEF